MVTAAERQQVLHALDGYRMASGITRTAVTQHASGLWTSLGSWRDADVQRFVGQVVPVVKAGRRQMASLTDSYLAAVSNVRTGTGSPVGIRSSLLDEIRGVPLAEVYRRPGVTTWTAVSNGVSWGDAMRQGLNRLQSMVATDMQLAKTWAARDVLSGDDRVIGYMRVTSGACCELCDAASDNAYHSEDLMPIHNNCVIGSTLVTTGPSLRGTEPSHLGGAHSVTRRWYAGETIILNTAFGHELTITPKHPVLTLRGWVAAGDLHEGDYLLRNLSPEWREGNVPDEHEMPSRIGERFRSGEGRALVAMPFSAEQFHGDGGEGEVDVVPADGHLGHWVLSESLEPLAQPAFAGRGMEQPFLPRLCSAHQRLLERDSAPSRDIGRRDDLSAILCGGSFVPQLASLGRGAPLDVESLQRLAEGRSVEPEAGRRLVRRLAGQVEEDRLVQLRRVDTSGHVFNLQTTDGFYTANGIVVHNCNCDVEPLYAGHDTTDLSARQESWVFKDAGGTVVADQGDTPEVREHGELGPVLTVKGQNFTGPDDIAA